jgi:hypothetical protein
MAYTAVMVIITDFLTGVLTAIVLYAILFRFFDKKPVGDKAQPAEGQPGERSESAEELAIPELSTKT